MSASLGHRLYGTHQVKRLSDDRAAQSGVIVTHFTGRITKRGPNLGSAHARTEVIDSELRLVAAVRWSIREHGGEPSSCQVDELLDERTALIECLQGWWACHDHAVGLDLDQRDTNPVIGTAPQPAHETTQPADYRAPGPSPAPQPPTQAEDAARDGSAVMAIKVPA
jgi:hypothetical protein